MPEGIVTKAILTSSKGPTTGQLKDSSTDEVHTFTGPAYAHFSEGDRVIFTVQNVHGRNQITHIKLHPDDAAAEELAGTGRKLSVSGASNGEGKEKKGWWARVKGILS